MNKKSIFGLCTLSLLLGACGGTPTAKPTAPAPVGANRPVDKALRDLQPQPTSDTGRWFVEFEGEPGSAEATRSGVFQSGVLAALSEGKPSLQSTEDVFTKRDVMQFEHLFNGISLALDEEEVEKVRKMPGVKALYPVNEIKPPTFEAQEAPVEPQMHNAINRSGVKLTHNTLGFTGKGVKVAIIDTGVNVNHPAFAGRIKKQWDFVGDDPNNRVEDPIADDCGGHGSHVAGIAAGNDPATGFKGVAPEADIYAYRVFGCTGGAPSDAQLKALERAYTDGADVVNLSLGGPWGWGHHLGTQAVNRLMQKGVVVVAAAGNEGDQGQHSLGTPATAELGIAVAAAMNIADHYKYSDLVVDGVAQRVYFPNNNLSNNGLLKDFVVADPIVPCRTATGDLPFKPDQYKGKVLIVDAGPCHINEQIENVVLSGPSGLVFIAEPGVSPFTPYVYASKPSFTFGTLNNADGEKLKAAVRAGKNAEIRLDTDAAAMADFSSIGDSPDLLMKPEITTPGSYILSAKALSDGYVVGSGTSMATPFAAGAAAVLLQKHPNLTALEVRDRLMNTATQMRNLEDLGKLSAKDHAQVQRQGAGMVNIYNAVLNTVSAKPAKLPLSASHNAPVQTHSVELINRGTKAETFDVRHKLALGYGSETNDLSAVKHNATMIVNGKTLSGNDSLKVTVPAGDKVELRVTVRPPTDAPEYSQYGGWLVAQNDESFNTVVVPYSGFKGDYQARAVLGKTITFSDDSEHQTPIFVDPVGEGKGQAEGTQPHMPVQPVFTFQRMNGDDGKPVVDSPKLLLPLAQPSSRLIVEAIDKNGNVVNTFADRKFMGRTARVKVDPARGEIPIFDWNGKNDAYQDVPAGEYRLQVRILRILGNPNNPAHWESYRTPLFKVQR